MTASLRAERLKLFTTRTYFRFLYAAAVLAAVSAFIGTATSPPPWHLSEPLHTGAVWTYGTVIVGVLALLLGARAFTEEFRHDTIVHTFVADPVRVRSSLAKAAVSAAAAAVLAAVSVAVMAGVVHAMAALSGGELSFRGSDATAALGLVGAGGAWGVLGVGLGALVRQQVPAIVGGLLWLLAFENLAAGLLGPVGAFLPGQVAQALARVPGAANGMVLPVAAAVISAYAAVLWSAGVISLRRRDVL